MKENSSSLFMLKRFVRSLTDHVSVVIGSLATVLRRLD